MRIRSYAYGVSAIAAVMLTVALIQSPSQPWLLVGFLGGLAFLAEWLAFTMPSGGTVSLAFAMHYAAVLLGGPVSGALVALFSTVSRQDVMERRPPYRVMFNAGQMVVSTLASGTTFILLGGTPLVQLGSAYAIGLSWIVAAFAAAIVQAAVNIVLVGFAISMSAGVALTEVWRRSFRSYMVSLVALTLLGLVLAQLVVTAGIWGVLLLVIPFFVSRQTFEVYQGLARAYRDTVTALVAVLEAKDPYTRGHSERVASYARAVGEVMGLSEPRVQRLELAALLHDIGKVGIAASTLLKPGSLTAEEFDEIRLHPITGSSLLQDIDFLADVTPVIEAHHERLDGTGYPYGLAADHIALEPRILAVADSFDAMTSNRAYRDAMGIEMAFDELDRHSPHRLSRECVVALREAVDQTFVEELLAKGREWRAEDE